VNLKNLQSREGVRKLDLDFVVKPAWSEQGVVDVADEVGGCHHQEVLVLLKTVHFT
jgi:hypothetical protein